MDRHWDDYLYRQYLRRGPGLYSRCALPQQHLRRATRPSVLRRWQELSHREPSLCQRRPLPRYGLPPRPSLGRRPLRSRKCALFEPGDRFRSPAASRAKSRRVRRAPSAQPPPTVETGPRPSRGSSFAVWLARCNAGCYRRCDCFRTNRENVMWQCEPLGHVSERHESEPKEVLAMTNTS